jgi:serine/threonine-protein kinase
MSNDQLERLLDQYEWCSLNGNPVSAEELCQDCPHLLQPLADRIARLKRFDAHWCTSEATTNIDGGITHPNIRRLPSTQYTTHSRFELQRELASGGLGEVYVANDLDVERRIAIKFLKGDPLRTPELAARFLREARITGSLDHPGVAPVFALGRDERQNPFYAMRLIGGRTMQAAIEELHRLTVGDAAFKVGQRRLLSHFVSVCQTVAFAHSRGVVHRDLKPLNVMLGDYGETIVVDWGLAKQLDAEASATTSGVEPEVEPFDRLLSYEASFRTTHGTISGTLGYMSPEQARGELDTINEQSDIYSLGGILFAIMTGKSAFAGVKTSEAILRTQTGNLPRPSQLKSHIPKSLEAVCLKAMAFDPANRYGSSMELAADIEHFIADEPVTARRESTFEWASRMLRRYRQPALIIGGALLVTTILLSAGILLLNRQKNETAIARDSAIANLETAISAIDGLYTEISENDLLHEPGAEELRKRLLERASIYYQRLQQTTSDFPQLELSSAQAMFRVAEIMSQTEAPDAAIESYKTAIGKMEQLWQTDRRPETRAALSTAYNGLARAHFELQQFELANERYDQALQLLRTSRDDESGDASTEQSQLLAGTLNSRGSNLLSQGKMAEAIVDFERAAMILEQLCQADPQNSRAIKTLAANQSNRAVASRMLAKNNDVVAMYEVSLKSYQRACEIDPRDDEARVGLAKTEFNLANFLSGTGQQASAVERYESAEHVFEQLVRDFPLRVSSRIFLAKTLLNHGIALARRRDADGAEARFQEAVKRFETIRSQYPALVEPAVDLVQAYQNLGNVIAGDEYDRDPKRAVEFYDLSISVAEKTLEQSPPATIRTRLEEVIKYSRQYRDECASAVR